MRVRAAVMEPASGLGMDGERPPQNEREPGGAAGERPLPEHVAEAAPLCYHTRPGFESKRWRAGEAAAHQLDADTLTREIHLGELGRLRRNRQRARCRRP